MGSRSRARQVAAALGFVGLLLAALGAVMIVMVPSIIKQQVLKNLMARALYDNVPECAEELAFRKGDILTVIEQNTGGLEGWWLCSLHGRQGIVPGNRVKLLIGPVQETSPSPDQPTSGLMHQTFSQQKLYQAPDPGG